MKVELLKCGDTEIDIANIARVSTDKWFEEWVAERDEGLIETLVFEEHWTPLGQIQLRFRFEMPIVVARQYLRSQVGQTFNEMSRRYIGMEDPPTVEWPEEWRGIPTKGIKQGSSGPLDGLEQYLLKTTAQAAEEEAMGHYTYAIDRDAANEQARWFLLQGTNTKFIQTGSLAYYNRVCELRLDPHAQAEVRKLAQLISAQIEPLFPYTWKCMRFLSEEKYAFRLAVKRKWRMEKMHPGSTQKTKFVFLRNQVVTQVAE